MSREEVIRRLADTLEYIGPDGLAIFMILGAALSAGVFGAVAWQMSPRRAVELGLVQSAPRWPVKAFAYGVAFFATFVAGVVMGRSW